MINNCLYLPLFLSSNFLYEYRTPNIVSNATYHHHITIKLLYIMRCHFYCVPFTTSYETRKQMNWTWCDDKCFLKFMLAIWDAIGYQYKVNVEEWKKYHSFGQSLLSRHSQFVSGNIQSRPFQYLEPSPVLDILSGWG